MKLSRELRLRIKEKVEWCDSRLAIIAITGLTVSSYLVGKGSEYGELTRRVAERIDYVCLGCGFIVVGIGATSWLLKKTEEEYSHVDPRSHLPALESATKSSLVFRSDSSPNSPLIRFFVPTEKDLDDYVEWTEDDEAIADFDNIPTYERKLLYETWYRANPKHFLMMQCKDPAASGSWQTVAISIVVSLPKRTYESLRTQKMRVVNILGESLRFGIGERSNRYLLYDILIFSKSIRSKYVEFKRWHSIFHFAQFAPPKDSARVSILIEPANKRLTYSLKKGRYGPYTEFDVVDGHHIYEIELPGAVNSAARASQFVMFWRLLRVKGWIIPVGQDTTEGR